MNLRWHTRRFNKTNCLFTLKQDIRHWFLFNCFMLCLNTAVVMSARCHQLLLNYLYYIRVKYCVSGRIVVHIWVGCQSPNETETIRNLNINSTMVLLFFFFPFYLTPHPENGPMIYTQGDFINKKNALP